MRPCHWLCQLYTVARRKADPVVWDTLQGSNRQGVQAVLVSSLLFVTSAKICATLVWADSSASVLQSPATAKLLCLSLPDECMLLNLTSFCMSHQAP